jgi:hypothetical protein
MADGRTLKQRLRQGVGWRLRKAKRAYDARYRPLSARRAQYEQLLNGTFATGSKSSIVFVVDRVGIDSHAAADVLGLAVALGESGHGVQVISVGKPVPDTDVVIGATPQFDPSTSSPEALRVAWARTEISHWVDLRFLAAYDMVLAPSRLAVTSLAGRNVPVELFRPAVDTALFGAS